MPQHLNVSQQKLKVKLVSNRRKNEKFEETMNLMTDSALARKEKEQNDQQWVRKHLSEI